MGGCVAPRRRLPDWRDPGQLLACLRTMMGRLPWKAKLLVLGNATLMTHLSDDIMAFALSKK